MSAISLQGVSKRFGETEVLHGIDLEIPAGEVVCVIGPSGSGKSTLLRCIAFLEEPTAGLISVYGEPLGFAPGPDGTRQRLPRARIHAVRSHVGMVFQQFNLWPHMTALGNVSEALKTVRRLPAKEAAARAMAQLDKVGLAHHAEHYPSQLSGGQQQRPAAAPGRTAGGVPQAAPSSPRSVPRHISRPRRRHVALRRASDGPHNS